MSEPELIEGILQRERKALNCLVDRFQPQIVKTAYFFLGNMDDTEDIAQEVFEEILKSIGKFRGNSSLSTWIYRITVNKSINHKRKYKRMEMFVRMDSWLKGDRHAQPEPAGSIRDLDDRETRMILNRALHSLPGSQRTAFILHKYEDLSYRQVAEVMLTTVPAVESLIQRARQNLRQKLIIHFPEYEKGN